MSKGDESYTTKDFARELEAELSKGYDVVRIARRVFASFHEHCRDISPDLYKKMFQIIAMEEGPEFELSEQELREFVAGLTNEPGHASIELPDVEGAK